MATKTKSSRFWPVPLLLSLAALACSLLGSTPAAPGPATPTSGTMPSPTPQAGPTPMPATPTPTLPPELLVPEAILILEPGRQAALASPIHVAGEADPTFEQNLVITVSGEDGSQIGMTSTTIHADAGQRGPFEADVDFSLAADQPGRISVYHTSANDGGLVHLASVEVQLLASGTSQAGEPVPHPEDLVFFEPGHGFIAHGGTLHVAGFSYPVFESTLTLVLCGEGGSGEADPVCGHRNNVLAGPMPLPVAAPDVGQPGPFTLDVAYSVSATTHGRVAVYSTSPRDGGLTHLSSRFVILEP